MKGSKKIASIAFFVASLGGYIAAIAEFFGEPGSTTSGIVYMCLGSACLCLGAAYLNMNKKDNDNK